MKPKLKSGDKHGRLTVVGQAGRQSDGCILYKCLCECGNERIVSSKSFSQTTECRECAKKHKSEKLRGPDITGEVFGDLTVIGTNGVDQFGSVLWECRCKCGGVISMTRYQLKNKKNLNCGKCPKVCKFCGETFIPETWNQIYCRNCVNTKDGYLHTQAIKKKLVEYKGGHCEICGYNKSMAALCFHHKDPSTKKFEVTVSHHSMEERYKEVDKCTLLCMNCHAELHEKLDNRKEV